VEGSGDKVDVARPEQFQEAGVRVAFQGERGANSEEAAFRVFSHPDVAPYRTLAHVFAALAEGQVAYAVAPVENSQAGSINATYDLLLRHHQTLTVLAEYDLRVRHYLLALPGQQLSDIHEVYSHQQALDQCSEFLAAHNLVPMPEYDTAGSALLIRQRELRGGAAIAPRRAAAMYGLEILAEDIQTNPNNYTKFLVVGPLHRSAAVRASVGAGDPRSRKTSLVFATHNVPGALYEVLGVLMRRGINLTKLESRPSRDRPWEYIFYADVEGDRALPEVAAALVELASHTRMLEVLGSYPIIGERAS